MDSSGSRGPPPPRSRTSSTSSLRSPSGASHQQAPATPPRGSGTSPATSTGIAYAGSHTPSRQLSTGSLVGVPFQGVSPDQLIGAVGGTGRMRCPSIASIDQLSSSSRSSSIPPTPAPTPNPLLQVSHHMVHEQLVAGIKQLNADEGYIDSTSFPATPAPSPFSPSPAQVSQFSPDQVAEGIQRLREEATREERSGSIFSGASGLMAGRLASATGINNPAHIGSGIATFGGVGLVGHGIGGSSGTSTGQPPTPSSTPGPPGLAAAAIAHHQLGVIPEHLAESIQRNLRPTDEGLESTSSPGTPVPTPISPSMSHQMQHQSNVLPEQLVAGIHRLKEVDGMSSGGSSALPSTPAPTPFSHHPGGVRPEDLAAGISRLSVIEEGDVQQQQSISINVSAHEATAKHELSATSPAPKLSQYFSGSQNLLDKSVNSSSKPSVSITSGAEQFFDQLHVKSQKLPKLTESQQSTSVLQSCRESKVDISASEEQAGKEKNKGEACLDILDQEFDDVRSLQRRTSQEHMKQSRSRNESIKTDDEEPKLCTFFSESQSSISESVSYEKEKANETGGKDPFANIARTQTAVKPNPPKTLETPKITEQLPNSNYSTPVAPTPTNASSVGNFSSTIATSSSMQSNENMTHSTTIPKSATPLLPQPISRFDPTQPIRSPLPTSNISVKSSNVHNTYGASTERPANNNSFNEAKSSEQWSRSDSAWIPCQNTAHILSTVSPDTPPDRSMITMPCVHAREDLLDPVKSLVARYRGEAEAGKRNILTADMVSQDLPGLFQLIQSCCYRAAINLTTRILSTYGQGPGQNSSATRHSTASLKVWYIRLSLLVHLKQFSTVEVEAEAFGDLDRVDLYYEYYSRMETNNQESSTSKYGSIVPFGLRLLLAELPQYLGKHNEAIDRLHHILAIVDKILLNLNNKKLENGQNPSSSELNDLETSKQLWKRRKIKVLFTISNCAVLQKDFELSIMTLEMIIEISEEIEEKINIRSSIGRVFLQLGDVNAASNSFENSKILRNQLMASCSKEEYNKLKVEELIDDALVLMSNNNFTDALTTLDQADKLDSGNPLIINNKSVCLLYLGRLKDALANLESEITSNPANMLREAQVLNLATLYELESSYAGQKKQSLLDLLSQYGGDGASTTCLKF